MRGPVGWAWVRDDGHWQSNGWFEGTNQTAELHGIRSVLLFHPHENLLIQMDSQYALNVTSKWAYGWEKQGWVKKDGTPVANKKIIEEILNLIRNRTHKTEFQWVKGHLKTGEFPLNVEADKRAGEASSRAAEIAKSVETSFLIYQDSKNREILPQEKRMLQRIYLT